MTKKRRTRESNPPSPAATRLNALLQILEEKVKFTDTEGTVTHLAAREGILKQLLKLSISGQRRARRLLQGEGRASGSLELALERASTAAGAAKRNAGHYPLIVGGVLTVPASVDCRTFCAQHQRGLTDEEWAHYTRLASIEFKRRSESVNAKAMADRQQAGAADRAAMSKSSKGDVRH